MLLIMGSYASLVGYHLREVVTRVQISYSPFDTGRFRRTTKSILFLYIYKHYKNKAYVIQNKLYIEK